jgi:hypothetical protein
MMRIAAKDMSTGAHFIHADQDGWKTEHRLIRKTIYPNYIELNQFKHTPDDMIEVMSFDDPKDETIAKLRKQITTLKAALIEHIAQEKIAAMGRFGFVLDTAVCDPYGDAKKQLARELPEIDWKTGDIE